MKSLQVLALLTTLLWTASDAWAQFGLYGSPGLVELPPVPSETWDPFDDPGRMAVPSYAGPMEPMAGSWNAQPVPPGPTSLSQQPAPTHAGPALPSYAGPPMQPVSMKRPRQPKNEPPSDEPPQPELAPETAPSVVDQMLSESSYEFPPPWGPEPGCEPAGCGIADDCGDSCLPCFQPKWYASVSGLILGRGDRPNKVWVTYQFTAPENQLLHTGEDFTWEGGGEIRFGRRFCCGTWTLEAAYWTLNPYSSMSRVTSGQVGDLLATPLDFQDVGYATIAGGPGDLFNGAEEHRVWRENEVHNVELSLIRDRVEYFCSGPFSCAWSVGARYLRFEEDLLFGSLDEGGLIFGIDPTLEGYLDDRIVNHLVGAQFGCELSYRRGNWALLALPKVGIYNNHIQNRFTGYRGDGELFAAVPAGYPDYPVSSAKDVVAFLTEIDLGLEWQYSAKWSAAIGYRVTVATGMGFADHQIPFYVVDTPEIADIDYNGYLLLHGGFARLTYRF